MSLDTYFIHKVTFGWNVFCCFTFGVRTYYSDEVRFWCIMYYFLGQNIFLLKYDSDEMLSYILLNPQHVFSRYTKLYDNYSYSDHFKYTSYLQYEASQRFRCFRSLPLLTLTYLISFGPILVVVRHRLLDLTLYFIINNYWKIYTYTYVYVGHC